MVTIEQYTPKKSAQVAPLKVQPEQVQFTISDVLSVIEQLDDHEHPHLILDDGVVVGFFLLDMNYLSNQAFDVEIDSHSAALGIRALLIDETFQGRGIATQALQALPDYLKRAYSEKTAAYLTVNCRNVAAYQCYLKAGFQDTGNLYHGGPVGPQYIMTLSW
ncbi:MULTISPECIES: GNAT family N-acetyltransferase [Vibrio]|uniref:GNAT family N-acetyltransferase n=1 Tax=Vibrio casei TaxID=673372 RepID=A0A368LIY7_9VIBR|nr:MULTISPECIES: GNAT family N-acetyltransferase [Vibrio]RCS70648.1 GNAT family N-acetyltransferase [Vibrio casei]SJN27083.1 Histone acetyltransferase HPA2 and related acetyltransferases [Vibrio casei]HBV76399.1 N-acetyltransferase [Vibrio sp.]